MALLKRQFVNMSIESIFAMFGGLMVSWLTYSLNVFDPHPSAGVFIAGGWLVYFFVKYRLSRSLRGRQNNVRAVSYTSRFVPVNGGVMKSEGMSAIMGKIGDALHTPRPAVYRPEVAAEVQGVTIHDMVTFVVTIDDQQFSFSQVEVLNFVHVAFKRQRCGEHPFSRDRYWLKKMSRERYDAMMFMLESAGVALDRVNNRPGRMNTDFKSVRDVVCVLRVLYGEVRSIRTAYA